jgi:hypothetical protein
MRVEAVSMLLSKLTSTKFSTLDPKIFILSLMRAMAVVGL